MSLDPALRERLDQIVRSDRVVLFMKGNPDAPQCGFSAQVVSILGRLLPTYGSFDVLSDREVREGIKDYSNWPTIPQLYVDGEFQGGCDIVKELYASGELQTLLGVKLQDVPVPKVTVSDDAAVLLRGAVKSQGGELHVAIDASFKHSLSLGPREGHEIAVESNGLTILFDRESALRANGLRPPIRSHGWSPTPGSTKAGRATRKPSPRKWACTPRTTRSRADVCGLLGGWWWIPASTCAAGHASGRPRSWRRAAA